jgi:hypothetical protein
VKSPSSSMRNSVRAPCSIWTVYHVLIVGVIFIDEVAGYHVAKMYYTNFDRYITLKHGIALEGWPLPKFAAPGDFGTKPELEVLRSAFSEGKAKFVKLNNDAFATFAEEFAKRSDEPDLESDEEREDITQDTSTPTPTCPTPEVSPTPVPTALADASLPVPPPAIALSSPSSPIAPSSPTSPVAPSSHTPPVAPAAPDNTKPMSPSVDEEPPRKRQKTAKPRDPFVAISVSGLNGELTTTTTSTRKVRSDKGVKRGPRKKATPPSALTPA